QALLLASLRFLDQGNARAFARLVLVCPVVAKAMERKARAGAPADDLGLLNLVMRLQPEPLYLILQELMHGVPNGLHRLAGAGNAQRALGTLNQQVLSNGPGLDATTAAVQDLGWWGSTERKTGLVQPHLCSDKSKCLIVNEIIQSEPS